MAEGIGARLRSARERSRLTILQAAEKLHVDADILEALEAEDFTALGAPVYVKGHLRHYAQLVGESVDALFDLYSQGTRVPAPDLTRIPKPVPDDAGRLVAPAVMVVLGFAIAGLVWWGLSLPHRQWLTTASRPLPLTISAATPAGEEPPAPATQLVPPTQPVRVALGGGMPTVGSHAAALPALASVAGTSLPSSAKVAAARGGEVQIMLTYSADSWTEVYDATGRRLLYGMASGPATRKLHGPPPLDVMLGDARSITLEVGGRAESISPFVRPDHTARFLIGADGRLRTASRKKGG